MLFSCPKKCVSYREPFGIYTYIHGPTYIYTYIGLYGRPAATYYKAFSGSGFPRGQPHYVQPEYGYAPSSSHPTFPQPRPARYAPPVNLGQRSNYASHFTAPSTPVVAVMVPRGPRGPRGNPSHRASSNSLD